MMEPTPAEMASKADVFTELNRLRSFNHHIAEMLIKSNDVLRPAAKKVELREYKTEHMRKQRARINGVRNPNF